MSTKESWKLSLLTLRWGAAATFGLAWAGAVCGATGEVASHVKLAVEPGHPWTPPFGLDRVGRPMDAVVEVPAGAAPTAEYVIVAYRNGKEIGRQTVTLMAPSSPGPTCRFGRVALDQWPSEVALWVRTDSQREPAEVARAQVKPPGFEADAVARPDTVIHPVDLGTILVPADWLLLAGGQQAEVEVAVLLRGGDTAGAAATAWYESAPDHRAKTDLALKPGLKVQAKLAMGPASKTLKRDTLHVAIADGMGKEMWRKDIPVMLIPDPPRWPTFGAVNTKLRYDAPIQVARGQPINYDDGWDPKLDDVVVFLPNGARFIFWRGSSYCPFWAGRSNTGFSYEWAEISGSHMVGARDCVEPLQDKELRYGRVEIVESTPARVHVRWSYQSCDLDYKVWGDFATEDYYFYPDGLGTRVMTLTAVPGLSFIETNEFISFSPQSGYPFEYVPANLVDILWPEGKAEFRFPCVEQEEQWAKLNTRPKDATLLYRIRLGKSDVLAAIHYSPCGSAPDLPGFAPFYDRGAMVTPMYWGCHWPLSRGYPTGSTISDLIHATPGSNCSIHDGTPKPIRSETGTMSDAQGHMKTMQRSTWVWLVGMTDASDDDLRQWAHSFAHPPKLNAQGAQVVAEPYTPERRALRVTIQDQRVVITIIPAGRCVNPVFELEHAPKTLSVRLDDRPLPADRYRWDGATLWLSANLDRPATLRLEFADAELSHAENSGPQHGNGGARNLSGM